MPALTGGSREALEVQVAFKGGRYIYVVCDTRDSDLPIFVADTAKEVADFLGITKGTVKRDMRDGWLSHGRYSVSKVRISDRD